MMDPVAADALLKQANDALLMCVSVLMRPTLKDTAYPHDWHDPEFMDARMQAIRAQDAIAAAARQGTAPSAQELLTGEPA